jgi:glyoxylase-like metal-dependent hydrolase (beta-lactamase superfamily II)
MKIATAARPPLFKNGYVVSCETTREAVFIDPGDEVDELLDVIAREQLAVKEILLTHAHFDHVTGVARAKAALGVDIWLHPDDHPLYDGVIEQARAFGFSVAQPPAVDHWYEPNTVIRFGHYTVEVLATPGHCPGGVCLAVGADGSADRDLFVGDTLFAGSIGRADLPGANLPTLMRSIRDVLFRFPDSTRVYPGHGPATTIGVERQSNPFLR